MAETNGDKAVSEEMTHPEIVVPEELRTNVFVATLDKLYNWGRKSSIWPLSFGLACCAIEMICAAASRYDWGRFGMDITRPSPRQADLLIVSGTVTKKMVPQIVRIYNQMAQPKYVISMGACATGGGPFKEGYNVVPGIDKYLPVDVYVPGCPPTPEALIYGFVKLHEKVMKQSFTTVPWYHSKESDLIPVPILGPDIYDQRRVPEIKEKLAQRRQEAVVVPEVMPEPVEPRNKGPVPSPTPTAPPGPTKLTTEEIEARRQAALEKRSELKERQAEAGDVPEGVDAKKYKIEMSRVRALERKLAQAERGEGKQTPEQVRGMLTQAQERLERLIEGN